MRIRFSFNECFGKQKQAEAEWKNIHENSFVSSEPLPLPDPRLAHGAESQ